jgi:hypothetical protein
MVNNTFRPIKPKSSGSDLTMDFIIYNYIIVPNIKLLCWNSQLTRAISGFSQSMFF